MTGAIQSALAPHGPEAAAIAGITWILVWGAATILALVIVLTALALFAPQPWLTGRGLVVGGGIVLPATVLGALLLYTLLAAHRPPPGTPADVVIEVVGHQWWWQIHYLDGGGGVDFVTANEIHLPVGRPVELRLRSADVLHSFWVPPLAGKLDLVPGKDNRMRLAADAPGLFRGQCAEYCGGPHAQMGLLVVAEKAADFEAWRNAQRRPQAGTSRGAAAHGKRLFLSHCAACHTVRGTQAVGELGPDLTHFASRLALGAAILPNNAGTVSAWIAASQHLKPGNLMPAFRSFDGAELHALATWLGTLE